MGRRYYCEYCDKSFSDNPTMRKNHMKGGFHQRNKKMHYDTFRDPSIILNEELRKKPCRKFGQGDCHFGEGCMFSHLTDERRQELEGQIRVRQENKKRRHGEKDPSLEEWLAKRAKRNKGESSSDTLEEETDIKTDFPVFQISRSLLGYTNLPPSVIPPTPLDMSLPNDAQWG